MASSVAQRIRIFLLVLAVPLGLFAQRNLVIEGGTLIDGTGRAPLRDAVIVIEGNKIAAVGQKGQVSSPAGAQVIQAPGKFILPGLIDLHVHWDSWMPELFLAHGVTTAVDLSSTDWTVRQRQILLEGRMRGPRLFVSAGIGGGRLLWDSPPSPAAESAQIARQLTREAGPGREKYNLTKAYTELTPDQLQAIADESHKAGRNVVVHLGSLDARQAAEAGVDALAHASGVAVATILDPVKAEELRNFARLGISVDYPLYVMYHAFMDPAKVDDLIALLVQKNVRIEPDLVNTSGRGLPTHREVWKAEDSRLLQDPNLHYIPLDNQGRVFYYDAWDQLDSQQRDQFLRGYANLQTFLHKFVQAGGKLLAGCDTASFVLPGVCLHREMELYVEAGLTPLQAIQAATKNSAEFLQESELGTIEPGKLADLLIVRENPLANIRNTKTVEVVIKDGEVIDTRYHDDFVNPEPRPPRDFAFPHPKPFLRAIYPMSSRELNKDVKLTLEGTNFADESVVEFEGVAVPTTPVKSTLLPQTVFDPRYTQLTATIPGRRLNRMGTYRVVVKNPQPHGGTSNVQNFFIAR